MTALREDFREILRLVRPGARVLDIGCGEGELLAWLIEKLVLRHLVNQEGVVHAYQFYPAVICSHARLTYTEVAAVLLQATIPLVALAAAALLSYLCLPVTLYHSRVVAPVPADQTQSLPLLGQEVL